MVLSPVQVCLSLFFDPSHSIAYLPPVAATPPAASVARFCCMAWCSAKRRPTRCVILRNRAAQFSAQAISDLSRLFDRKEETQEWKHRSTNRVYILHKLKFMQCQCSRRKKKREEVSGRQGSKMLDEKEINERINTLLSSRLQTAPKMLQGSKVLGCFEVAYTVIHLRETVFHLHLLHFLHKLLLLQRAELCLEVRVHLSILREENVPPGTRDKHNKVR